jgi:hypothetical protein
VEAGVAVELLAAVASQVGEGAAAEEEKVLQLLPLKVLLLLLLWHVRRRKTSQLQLHWDQLCIDPGRLQVEKAGAVEVEEGQGQQQQQKKKKHSCGREEEEKTEALLQRWYPWYQYELMRGTAGEGEGDEAEGAPRARRKMWAQQLKRSHSTIVIHHLSLRYDPLGRYFRNYRPSCYRCFRRSLHKEAAYLLLAWVLAATCGTGPMAL